MASAASQRITPRKWQEAALAVWARRQRGIVAAVTGAGKTTFALLCISAWLESNTDGRIFIVVPTTALLDQWYITLTDDYAVAESDIAVLAGGRRTLRNERYVICVINTARHHTAFLGDTTKFFLIVDECHRAGSDENAKALRGAWSATLGLSATPEREYDDGFLAHIEPALGPIIYRYDYNNAFADGVIVPFDLINIQFDLSDDEAEEYSRLSRLIAIKVRQREDVEDLLRKRARVSWNSALRIPLAAKLAIQSSGSKVIVFHESVDAASKIQSLLEGRGVRATIYHTRLSALRRRENLRQFRKGLYTCLVCCRALDEGLNVPGASVAVVASGTGSSRQRIQRLGRVLRSQGGKRSALIYTLFATKIERERLDEEAARLEGVANVRWMQAKIADG